MQDFPILGMMSDLSEDQIRHVAKLARLRLSDEEVKKFAPQLSAIFGYIDLLNELDTDDTEPTAQVTGTRNAKRADEVCTSETTKDDLLACSPLPIVNDTIETLSAHG